MTSVILRSAARDRSQPQPRRSARARTPTSTSTRSFLHRTSPLTSRRRRRTGLRMGHGLHCASAHVLQPMEVPAKLPRRPEYNLGRSLGSKLTESVKGRSGNGRRTPARLTLGRTASNMISKFQQRDSNMQILVHCTHRTFKSYFASATLS
eukprot:764466-Hanusia_phi.AAC.2